MPTIVKMVPPLRRPRVTVWDETNATGMPKSTAIIEVADQVSGLDCPATGVFVPDPEAFFIG
jgi:hypothetical protein